MEQQKIVVYPTDTVWGIGCNINSLPGCHKVMAIKGSSFDKPVSILFSEIDSVYEYFNISSIFPKDWLRGFFRLETTLCVSRDLIIDKKVPQHIYQNSSLVAFRCLDSTPIRQMIGQVGGPVITTSLNFSGEQPILSYKDALNFCEKINERVEIYDCQDGSTLSGHSSTIVSYDINSRSFSFLREGYRFSDVQEYCRLFSA